MRRYTYPFDVARYRRLMGARLRRYNVDRPYCRPLVPIPELHTWYDRARREYPAASAKTGRKERR